MMKTKDSFSADVVESDTAEDSTGLPTNMSELVCKKYKHVFLQLNYGCVENAAFIYASARNAEAESKLNGWIPQNANFDPFSEQPELQQKLFIYASTRN